MILVFLSRSCKEKGDRLDFGLWLMHIYLNQNCNIDKWKNKYRR